MRKFTIDIAEQATVSINDPHHYITEASTLQIRPGKFPLQIDTAAGNGQPFVAVKTNEVGALYRQGNGCLELTVFND